MTSKEALETIKELELDPYKGYKTVDYLYKNEIEILEKLVEKDTPKKPIVFNYEEHRLNHIECQNGCKPFKDKEYKFCPKCGQRIDWSE